jgi:hypothetical protein
MRERNVMSLKCSNPSCSKIYNITDKGADSEFCSFECWETINCLEPKEVHFEELSFNGND